MTETTRHFLPAAGHDLLLPLYDPLTRALGVDRTRRELVRRAELRPGQRVLDVGCGTGSLLRLIEASHPEVEAIGLDPDPKALARARRKLRGRKVRLEQGQARELPWPASTFQRVLSSFVFHHLGPDEQRDMLSEAHRVLEPGGRLLLVDFAGPDAAHPGRFARWLHGKPRLAGNAEARVRALLEGEGFEDIRAERAQTWLGAIVHYQAARAEAR